MERRFTSSALSLWSGLLIYALQFLFVYIFAALACAKGFAAHRWWGLPLIPAVTTISGILAAGGIALIIYRTCGRRTDTGNASVNFGRFVMVAAGVLSLVAVAWLTLPPLLVTRSCAM